MKAVVQRVARASVKVDGQVTGQIDRGLLVLLGIGKDDDAGDADWMINKLLALRIFPDDAKNMNRSVTDVAGGILVVSQFTLYGDARKGTRPSFTDAMPPGDAEKFYRDFMTKLRAATTFPVAAGKFAAMMDVELVNDGPVTIVLDSRTGVPPVQASPESNGRDARSTTTFIPFDPSAPVAKHARNLPHWEQAGRTYFVTFRLADSLPREKLEQWTHERDVWRRTHPEPLTSDQQTEYDQQFGEQFQEWLDAGHGECLLRQPGVAGVVAGALRHFDGQRYDLVAFVIMPNHVHAIVSPLGEWTLEQVLHSWKSYSAHAINRQLSRIGPVWQPESFDHLVRDERALERYAEYLRQNPIKAGLHADEYVLDT